MTLTELLEYTAAQYLDDRVELIDGDGDDLWQDSFLVRQFNEAQRLLARRSWCLIDEGHKTAGVIVLRTGVVSYPLHKSILRLLRVTPTDQEGGLNRTDDATLRSAFPYDDWWYNIDDSTSSPGRPIAFSTDGGTRMLRTYRAPDTDENGLRLILTVVRLPVVWLTLDDVDASPEVPDDYHYALCTFAAGKALTQPNVDGQQKETGRLLLAEFDAACREARQDRQRANLSHARWGFASDTATL